MSVIIDLTRPEDKQEIEDLEKFIELLKKEGAIYFRLPGFEDVAVLTWQKTWQEATGEQLSEVKPLDINDLFGGDGG